MDNFESFANVCLSPTSDFESNQPEWQSKACDMLEQQIAEIRADNANLVTNRILLTSCLNQIIEELYQLQYGPTTEPLSSDQLNNYLVQFSKSQSLIQYNSNYPSEELVSTYQAPTTTATTTHSPRRHSKPKSKLTRQKSYNYSKLSSISPNTAEDESMKIQSIKNEILPDKIDPPLEVDSETTTRNAFRLFAKYIGSSLKREYRIQFNAPPTQTWLANQLLTRWEQLNPNDKQSWYKRAKLI